VPRLDVVLVRLGLAETRELAQSLILSGAVLVDDHPATRPALPVEETADITLKETGPPYVSRGALKLEAALDQWQIDPTDLIVLDAGASTGGFTDLLLRRGAQRVYAVDVGYGQLHYKLRGDPRIVLMERTNIRYLEQLPEQADLAVADLSFISLKLALPAVFNLMKPDAQIVALVKPQFEAGRADVKKGGVVRDPAVRQRVIDDLKRWSEDQPWRLVDQIPSPIKGPAGNEEILTLWLRR
jgi:23S rRNA (cytidine1920-2'-O)/16S rRNA (cytidine1409-2'-O)-methyltransferase